MNALANGTGDTQLVQDRIVFRASAGMVSGAVRLTIAAGGEALLERRGDEAQHLRIPAAAADQLRSLLEGMHFRRLDRYYGPRAATDVPAYEITYGGHTVRTESGSPPAPASLWAVVTQLNLVVEEARAPSVLDLTVSDADGYLHLTLRRDRTAVVDRGSGAQTTRVSQQCLDDLREASEGLSDSELTPGLLLRTGLRNPGPALELTRDFSSFHAALDKSPAPPVARLIERARAAAISSEA